MSSGVNVIEDIESREGGAERDSGDSVAFDSCSQVDFT